MIGGGGGGRVYGSDAPQTEAPRKPMTNRFKVEEAKV